MCEDCFQKPIRNEMWKAEMFGKRILRNNLATTRARNLLTLKARHSTIRAQNPFKFSAWLFQYQG